MRFTAVDPATPKKWVEIDGVRKDLSLNLIKGKFNSAYKVGKEVDDYKLGADGKIYYIIIMPDKKDMEREGFIEPSQPVSKQRSSFTANSYNFYCAYVKDITVALIQAGIFKDSMTAMNFYKKQSIEHLNDIKKFDSGEIDG
jgi:hypothetical protein